ncbi:Gpi16 subunit, GPI transamidase component-domain-containing protein [Lactarius sanguifluus]|nr:Gpi16 subunit, GPI transamidase component-domain-containing protein [Lactarius sanguifluus]
MSALSEASSPLFLDFVESPTPRLRAGLTVYNKRRAVNIGFILHTSFSSNEIYWLILSDSPHCFWDYNHWGHPGEPGVGSGAELWAWMGHGRQYRRGTVFLIPPCEPDLPHSIDPHRKAFSLSGLFCASLGSMDVLHTTSPAHAILPTSELPRPPAPARDAYTRHTTLPAERMCTGNLKPSLKLLPCPSHTGAAALLEPNRIFDVESPTGMVGRACALACQQV